jgi:hypothetical protein
MQRKDHTFLFPLISIALFLGVCVGIKAAPISSAFTYQGRLSVSGEGPSGQYDFQFRLFAVETNGTALAGPINVLAVPVSNGLFQATIDFGPGPFNGEARWLEIAVKNSLTDDLPHLLSPRQPITTTPYALHAANAGGLMSFANEPLDIKINGERVMRYEPATSPMLGFMPNIIGGAEENRVDPGVMGSTISGGGSADAPNRIIIATTHGMPGPPEFVTISGGLGNTISGASHVTIGGGAYNRFSQHEWYGPITPKLHSVISGGVSNAAGEAWMSTISGGAFNFMAGDLGHDIRGATIGGGVKNGIGTIEDTAYYPTIAGGYCNEIVQGTFASIGGGDQNRINNDSTHGTISGGGLNRIGSFAESATISGGYSNLIGAFGVGGTVGGGNGNQIQSDGIRVYNGTIGGGGGNVIGPRASRATIGGGLANSIGEDATGAVISGGESNQVNSEHGTISGGAGNIVQSNAVFATIGGGDGNQIYAPPWRTVRNQTIGGGSGNMIFDADHATISGGTSNLVSENAQGALIAGGRNNTIREWCTDSVISGGWGNYMGYWYAVGASIGGGVSNTVGGDTFYSTIAGGTGNHAGARNSYGVTIGGGVGNAVGSEIRAATIGGGTSNVISGNYSHFATIGGGYGNRMAPISVGATIGGGGGNTIGQFERQDSSGQFGLYAVISGGLSNRAITPYSTVAGGRLNVAGGSNSFAAGYRAQATNDGTFVWADLQDADFASTGTNQFLIRASGGVGINTDSPQFALHVNGEAGKPGGGAWSVASDARLKKDIRPLEQALARLLQLHGVTYEYKDPKTIHELPGQQTGMVAQEVEKVFPEWVETAPDGMRRLSIRGFEALAVEALRDLRTEKDAQISALEKRLAALEAKLSGGSAK